MQTLLYSSRQQDRDLAYKVIGNGSINSYQQDQQQLPNQERKYIPVDSIMMFTTILLILASLAATITAETHLAPFDGSDITKGKYYDVSWVNDKPDVGLFNLYTSLRR
jgi:hypothetical protein